MALPQIESDMMDVSVFKLDHAELSSRGLGGLGSIVVVRSEGCVVFQPQRQEDGGSAGIYTV